VSQSEQRRSPRIHPFVARCRLLSEGHPPLLAYVTELGSGGARLRSEPTPPPVGTSVTLIVALGRGRTHLPGAIKWVKLGTGPDGGHVFGVGFAGETDGERATLEAALEEFRRRAALLA